jgi:ubiquinone/menaquinone biosynthesis C-methylase UbiE
VRLDVKRLFGTSDNPRNLGRFPIQLFHELSGKTVLEVGCGDGSQVEVFAGRGCECFGLDIVKESMKKGQKTKHTNMVVGDACCLPFRTDSFDIVFSNEFFSHVTNTTIALREQCRVLRPKGQLQIRDDNIFSPTTLFDLLILYPIRTKGRYGGLRWLITRDQVKKNVYGSRFMMKDENIKSLLWWKKQARRMDGLKLELATTSYTPCLPKLAANILELFAGQNIIMLRKTRACARKTA